MGTHNGLCELDKFKSDLRKKENEMDSVTKSSNAPNDEKPGGPAP